MPAPCRHPRIRLIAQDDAATYVECLDCHQLFDAAELDLPPPTRDEPPKPEPDFNEDLSDA